MSSDETAAPASGTFTCESCGGTFDKVWSDEEAAAEAEENFPGLDVSDPAEAGVVCDDCYRHIMARMQAEAPEMIGPGWRGEPERPHCLPGCKRIDGHDGRDPGACMGPWSVPLWPSAAVPAWCYRLASGATVHVKPSCRC
jgi:hypothetical protein